MDRSVNQSVNDRGVCRTAPATPGLLNMQKRTFKKIVPFPLLTDNMEQKREKKENQYKTKIFEYETKKNEKEFFFNLLS